MWKKTTYQVCFSKNVKMDVYVLKAKWIISRQLIRKQQGKEYKTV